MHFPHRKNMHRFSQLAKGQIRPDAHKAHEPQEAPGFGGAKNMRPFRRRKRKLCALWWAETDMNAHSAQLPLPAYAKGARPSRARPFFFIPVCPCLYGRSAGAAGPARRPRPKPRPRSGAHFLKGRSRVLARLTRRFTAGFLEKRRPQRATTNASCHTARAGAPRISPRVVSGP